MMCVFISGLLLKNVDSPDVGAELQFLESQRDDDFCFDCLL